jgi:hypothetical protein
MANLELTARLSFDGGRSTRSSASTLDRISRRERSREGSASYRRQVEAACELAAVVAGAQIASAGKQILGLGTPPQQPESVTSTHTPPLQSADVSHACALQSANSPLTQAGVPSTLSTQKQPGAQSGPRQPTPDAQTANWHSQVSGSSGWPGPQNTHRSVGRPGRLGQIWAPGGQAQRPVPGGQKNEQHS